jgi:8-oxo-dGTP pyrophosphatase MutT (NUDIX family)
VTANPLLELLDGHPPQDDTESADLERAKALLAGEDPWAPWSREAPLHFTASALIVHPASHRVLLRHHERQGTWLHVGGHAEPGEALPLSVALREGVEETGLDDLAPWPDASLVHLVIVPVPASLYEPAHEHADLRFVLSTDRPDTARPERESAPLRWLSLPEARSATDAANLRETLHRTERLLNGAGTP